MSKQKTEFVCQQCGFASPKWQGQCPDCGQWNSFEEQLPKTATTARSTPVASPKQLEQFVQAYSGVDLEGQGHRRKSTGIGEFDRVLGSSDISGMNNEGLVLGSVIMLGGEPGIGKSTILTQLVCNWLINHVKNDKNNSQAEEYLSRKVMYVSGEESPSQIGRRIERLVKMYSDDPSSKTRGKSTDDGWKKSLLFVTTTNVDELCSIIETEKPGLVIVDSIQTITTGDLSGFAGSLGQLKESTFRITSVVKKNHIPTFLVGHVTKDGNIAGPKVLEHIVDAVLELSGERTGRLRVLRAIKNRYGATDEVGLFEMKDEGLVEVLNPGELFLQQSDQPLPGSVTGCIMEGSRPLLIEVQALVVSSQLAMPRRVAQGIPLSKLQVLCAVLQKHVKIPLDRYDVYVNIVGGLTVKEPSMDLAICAAILGSYRNQPIDRKMVFVGEVGLLGEIRQVNFLEKRAKEAKRLGFTQVISAQNSSTLLKMSAKLFPTK